MPDRIILKFDEFFKLACQQFFGQYGLQVESEVEIFKQPKRVDVLVIRTEGMPIPDEFSIFKQYWKDYNLISFKSPKDRIRRHDLDDALIYLLGFVNMGKEANLRNTTMSIIANHTPRRIFREYGLAVQSLQKGIYEINYNVYKVWFLNINELSLSSLDSVYLAEFGTTETFLRLLEDWSDKKMVDKLREIVYTRLRSFEMAHIRRKFMPATYEADITDWVKPYLDKSREEGLRKGLEQGEFRKALDTAYRMKERGYRIEDILAITGLGREELEHAGVFQKTDD